MKTLISSIENSSLLNLINPTISYELYPFKENLKLNGFFRITSHLTI
jgi:hypothetical protein